MAAPLQRKPKSGTCDDPGFNGAQSVWAKSSQELAGFGDELGGIVDGLFEVAIGARRFEEAIAVAAHGVGSGEKHGQAPGGFFLE